MEQPLGLLLPLPPPRFPPPPPALVAFLPPCLEKKAVFFSIISVQRSLAVSGGSLASAFLAFSRKKLSMKSLTIL
jgi:hypothetical protein